MFSRGSTLILFAYLVLRSVTIDNEGNWVKSGDPE